MKKFLYTAAVCLLAACRFPGASYGAQEQQTGEADAGIPAFPLWTGNANAANEESETESETETETEEIEPETEHHAIDRELLRQTLLVMRLKYGPEFTFAMRLPQESEELEESPRSEETETLETETEIPEEAAAPLIPRLTLKDAREMRDYPLPPLPTNIGDLEEKVTALTDSYSGSWSVYVKNLTTGDSFIVNDAPMKSASVMKLFIMASVYDAIDHQELERTSELVDRLSNMISYSSNEAANRLLILLGKGDLSAGVNYVNHYIQKHGYSDMTHEYNGFQDASLILDSVHFNQISAADCGLLLERVYHRDFSSRKVCNEIEDMMLKQQTRYKIPKGVPDGVLVGNKTGEMDIVENDVAVVYAPKSDYILCVFSSDWNSKDSAQIHIQEISSVVYDFFNDESYYRIENRAFLELLPDRTTETEKKTETEMETETEAESEMETDTETETESETGMETDTEAESESEMETETRNRGGN